MHVSLCVSAVLGSGGLWEAAQPVSQSTFLTGQHSTYGKTQAELSLTGSTKNLFSFFFFYFSLKKIKENKFSCWVYSLKC